MTLPTHYGFEPGCRTEKCLLITMELHKLAGKEKMTFQQVIDNGCLISGGMPRPAGTYTQKGLLQTFRFTTVLFTSQIRR